MVRRAPLVVAAVREHLFGQLAFEESQPLRDSGRLAERRAREHQGLCVPEDVVAEDVVLDVAPQVQQLTIGGLRDPARDESGRQRARGHPRRKPGRDDVRMPRRRCARGRCVDPRLGAASRLSDITAPRGLENLVAVVRGELGQEAGRLRRAGRERLGRPEVVICLEGTQRRRPAAARKDTAPDRP